MKNFILDTKKSNLNWTLDHEVKRCLLCKDAPCAKACSKSLKPDERIRALYFHDLYRATKDFPEELNLDELKKAEDACVLKHEGKQVKIREILSALKDISKNKKEVTLTPDLSFDICGVKLENPFLLSSSVVASSYEMCARAFDMGWAGVCYKTICNFDQHETSPRFSVLRNEPESFYGFKNIEQLSDHSMEENLEVFRKLKKNYPNKVIIASIMGRNEEEWEDLSRKCEEAGVDVIELNFSCPNMEDDALGVTIGQDEKLIEKCTKAARRGCTIPLLAKMTPNITDMVPMAIAAKRGGADGIAAINTILSITGVDIKDFTPEPAVAGNSALGGYSGAAVKPIALRFISDMAESKQLKDMHLSGMGGITTWRDALEFILLGAGSLQITTAVMQYGYRIIDDLVEGLKGFMMENNISDLYKLKGASLPHLTNLNNLERDTILFPKFDLDKCIGCGRCEISCADGGHQAISIDENRRPKLNGNKCVGCHLCIHVCPAGAISAMDKRIKRTPIHKE